MKTPKNNEPLTFKNNPIRYLADGMTRNHTSTIKQVEAFRRRLERQGDRPILVGENHNCLNQASELISVWNTRPAGHQINFGPIDKRQRPYALAHGLIRLQMEQAAAAAGKLKIPQFKPERILRHCGITAQPSATSKLRAEARELAKLMFNLPLDMVADYQLRSDFPDLIPAQNYTAMLRESSRPMNLARIRTSNLAALPDMLRALTAFCAASARFWDELLKETRFTESYDSKPGNELGGMVYARIQQHLQHASPGDEFQLVDDLCALVGLPDIYEWRLAPSDGPKRSSGPIDLA